MQILLQWGGGAGRDSGASSLTGSQLVPVPLVHRPRPGPSDTHIN